MKSQFNRILKIVGGRILPINRRQQVFPNGTLIVENVQRSLDQGTYTCVAKNAQGFSAKGNLEVQVMGEWCTFHPFNSTHPIQLFWLKIQQNFKKISKIWS